MQDTQHLTAVITQNALRQWIIQPATLFPSAWTGARWAPIDTHRLPAGDLQICNFPTPEAAAAYAKAAGLQPLMILHPDDDYPELTPPVDL